MNRLRALAIAAVWPAIVTAGVSVRDFGARGDGLADDTGAFQRSIEAVAAQGGGEVSVPEGVYALKRIELRNGVILRLLSGSRMRGSRNVSDYSVGGERNGMRLGFIVMRGVRDAGIVGNPDSIIDGDNSSSPSTFEARGVHAVMAEDCTNLVFRGYAVVNAGNYAHWFRHCADLRFDRVRVEGGHDGVHCWNSDRVTIEDCEFATGDDCVAGLDYHDLVVRRCRLNTPCQCLRLGGRRILVEDCELTGPGRHPHRCTLPRQTLLDGLEPVGQGRRKTLAAFLYFGDEDADAREDSGEIVIRNCRVSNVQRLFHCNSDGSEIWARGRPLRDIRFENVTAENVEFPLMAVSCAACPTELTFARCSVAFTKPVPEFIRTSAFGRISLADVTLTGVEGPLVRAWGRAPEVVLERVSGASGIARGDPSEKVDAHPILGFLDDYPEHEMSPKNPRNLKRGCRAFGFHFDFHAKPGYPVGATLRRADIERICRVFRPDFLQVDCKGHPGWASYPTTLGNAVPGIVGDPLRLWREVTAREGVPLYCHYSGVIDNRWAAEHRLETPLQEDGRRCADWEMKPTRCNGSYADGLLIPQLKELAGRYGVDGVWIDGDCWGAKVDYDDRTLAQFEKETGIGLMGVRPYGGTPHHDRYRDFCRELYRRYLKHLTTEVHREYPGFRICSNWAFSDHMPELVSADVDFISGDLDPADSFRSARYAGRAMAQQGKPWDLMAWGFRCQDGTMFTDKHPVQLMQEAAAILSLGGGYQTYVTQLRDGSPRMDSIMALEPLAKFVRDREPFCYRGENVKRVAVLLSTHDRSLEATGLYSRTGKERVMGLTSLVCDAGHVNAIVFEGHLAGKGIDDWPVLMVPELSHGLRPETVRSFLDYAERGGSLVLVGTNTCSQFAAAGAPCAVIPVKNALGNLVRFTMDGLRIGTLETRMALESDSEALARSESGEAFAAVRTYGKGRIAAVSGDLGAAYLGKAQYLHRELMDAILRKLYVPRVTVKAQGLVEVNELERNGRLFVQLVNANGSHASPNSFTEDFIPPALDVEVRIRLDEKPRAIIRQPEGEPLDCRYADGVATVVLPRLACHSALEVR